MRNSTILRLRLKMSGLNSSSTFARSAITEYQKTLEEEHCIDFQDMINESVELLHKMQEKGKGGLYYKYIIVDEYQDISRQRYNLVAELSRLCDAKIMAVGDDWQSIYAFSGSVLPLFTRFCQEWVMGKN